ncbi:hypothetical protein ACO0SA_001649 [Hanseniaspora valbyensis]
MIGNDNIIDEENFVNKRKLLIKKLKKVHLKNNSFDNDLEKSFKVVFLEILNNCNILPNIKLKRKKQSIIFYEKQSQFKISFININDIWFYNYTWKKQNIVILKTNPNIYKLYHDYILKFEVDLFKKIKETDKEKIIEQYYNLFENKFNRNDFVYLIDEIQNSDCSVPKPIDNKLNNEISELAERLIGKRNDLTLLQKEWIYQKAQEVVMTLQNYDSKESFLRDNKCYCMRNNCIHSIIKEMEPKYSEVKWEFLNSYYDFKDENEIVLLKEQAEQLKNPINMNVTIDFGNSIVNQSPLTEQQINFLTLGILKLDGFRDIFGYCPKFAISALSAKNRLQEDIDDDYKFVKDTYFDKDKTFVACSNDKHWFGFLISKNERMIYYFDSILAFGEDRGKILQTILLVLNGGLKYCSNPNEVIEKNFADWKIKNCPVPKQPDRYQCGDNLILNILEITRNYHDVLDIWTNVNAVPVVKVAKEDPNLYDLREFKFATPLKSDHLVLNYRNPNRVRSEYIINEYRRLQKKKATNETPIVGKKHDTKKIAKILIGNKNKLLKVKRKKIEEKIEKVLNDLNKHNLPINEYKKKIDKIDKIEKEEIWPYYKDIVNCFNSFPSEINDSFTYVPINNSLVIDESTDNKIKKTVHYKIQFDDIVGFKKNEVHWILEKMLKVYKNDVKLLTKFEENINTIIFSHKYAILIDYIDKNLIGFVFVHEMKSVFIIDPISSISYFQINKYSNLFENLDTFKIFNVTNILSIDKNKNSEIILKNLSLFLKDPQKIVQSWEEEDFVTIDKISMSKPSFNSFASNDNYEVLFEEVLKDKYKNKLLYRDLLQNNFID